MAKLSLIYGVFFILLTRVIIRGQGSETITLFIPILLGIPMLLLGLFGLNEKYFKYTTFGAAILMIIGFSGTLGGLIKFYNMISGTVTPNHTDVYVQAIVALMCLVFLALSVTSFIRTL